MIKKYCLFVFLMLSSCGPQEVEVSGTVNHTLQLNIQEIEKYFEVICSEEQPDDVEHCTKKKTAELIETLLKAGGG